MTPYYEHAGITIYHGDCREILPQLGRVELVVTDPPYGIGFTYPNYDDGDVSYHALIEPLIGRPLALLQYPEDMMRLVCPVLGAPDECLVWAYNSNLPRQSRIWGFWNINIDFGRIQQPVKNRDCAKVKGFTARSYDWISHIQQVKGNSEEKTEHPCQIPVELVTYVLKLTGASSVCDPFMGSGTTLSAAKSLGMAAIGVEVYEKYCEIAANRLSQEVLAFA